jgi:hypothetical protein
VEKKKERGTTLHFHSSLPISAAARRRRGDGRPARGPSDARRRGQRAAAVARVPHRGGGGRRRYSRLRLRVHLPRRPHLPLPRLRNPLASPGNLFIPCSSPVRFVVWERKGDDLLVLWFIVVEGLPVFDPLVVRSTIYDSCRTNATV